MSKTITLRCGGCRTPLTFEIKTWADPPERAYCDETCRQRAPTRARDGAATA